MLKKDAKAIYYSKVMLFGEYSIILGSMGLTIPYSHFNGQLMFINKDSYTDLKFARSSNQQLIQLFEYIKSLEKKQQLLTDFDTERLAEDLHQGLFFESSIPEGYGLGSSGALVASLYKEYAKNAIEARSTINDKELIELKNIFAQIESFYHGTSSGIDPLICYMKHPIVLENSQHISSVGIPRREVLQQDAIFLLDTEITGKTEPLVKRFMEKTRNASFRQKIDKELIPLTNTCIKSILKGDMDTMYQHLQPLSTFQQEHFEEMIPHSIRNHWEDGLSSQLYTLKLCGSGGGGFFLGFTRNYAATKDYFATKGKEIIPVYQEL